MSEQQTIWHEHEPVKSWMKDGTVLVICRTCGRRL